MADASGSATAEWLDLATVVTLGHRRFTVVRPNHVEHLELVP
ncbi:MAG: hypothetical protein ACRDZO_05095 [Egibacteraceae bacterium]